MYVCFNHISGCKVIPLSTHLNTRAYATYNTCNYVHVYCVLTIGCDEKLLVKCVTRITYIAFPVGTSMIYIMQN